MDKVFVAIDEDRSVCQTIKNIFENHNKEYEFAFANGEDQNNNSIPEVSVCEEVGIELIDGLGDKIQSSSWLLKI